MIGEAEQSAWDSYEDYIMRIMIGSSRDNRRATHPSLYSAVAASRVMLFASDLGMLAKRGGDGIQSFLSTT